MRRIALIVVADELNRPAEQATRRVDVVFPDLHPEQRHFAGAGELAGKRHAQTDFYRIGRMGLSSRNHRGDGQQNSRP